MDFKVPRRLLRAGDDARSNDLNLCVEVLVAISMSANSCGLKVGLSSSRGGKEKAAQYRELESSANYLQPLPSKKFILQAIKAIKR